ncbi:hypothetical protein [Mucilaginibacter defluvii]|uniref:Uncharacterized protein n=1 Tax=Mucilaginibacter defluvii TaxID=1196019 RepID=A0ABP9FN74_9SPHI
MNTELFQETLTRLRLQADAYRYNLSRYKKGLNVLNANINKFNVELLNTRLKFEKLVGEPSDEVPVMKLYSYNERVA